jgi:Flp pilus assembly protein CpaB
MRSKKNKKKIMIAVGLGLAATFLFFSSMNSNKAVVSDLTTQLQQQNAVINELKTAAPTQSQQVQDNKIFAVMAAKDIKVGDTFILDMLKTEKYLETDLPEGYYTTTAMVVGNKASRNITAGQFITTQEIQTEDLSSIDIPEGSRAVTIPVDRFKGVASYLKVGAKVDIMKLGSKPKYIAQNIKIISFEIANTGLDSSTTSGKFDPKKLSKLNPNYISATQASAITFLVPLDVVSKIVDAMGDTTLQIISRNNRDNKIYLASEDLPPPPPKIKPPSDNKIVNLPGPPSIKNLEPPAPVKIVKKEEDIPPPETPKEQPHKIELYKGNTMETKTFSGSEISMGDSKQDSKKSSDINKSLKDLLDLAK